MCLRLDLEEFPSSAIPDFARNVLLSSISTSGPSGMITQTHIFDVFVSIVPSVAEEDAGGGEARRFRAILYGPSQSSSVLEGTQLDPSIGSYSSSGASSSLFACAQGSAAYFLRVANLAYMSRYGLQAIARPRC